MSVSPVDPGSTDPIHIGEYQAVADLLYSPTAVELRWVAGDALMMLSVIAEHIPDDGEKDDPTTASLKRTATRAIRRARIQLEQAHAREAAV